MTAKSIKSLQGANDSTVESSFREADDSNGEPPTNVWGLAEMFTKMKVAMNRLTRLETASRKILLFAI